MIFEGLSTRLQDVFKKLKGHGKLTEADVDLAMREVRLALLEADVNFKVVKGFVEKVRARAVGSEVLESLTPAQQVIKIVDEELVELMGGTVSKINISSKPPTIIMMVGLQGSGKTTSSGKLANALRKQGKKPLLVAADVYRPAAIKQLEVLGTQLDIPVFSMGSKVDPVNIAAAGVEQAVTTSRDVVIIDTAGRLHIDEEMMEELSNLKSKIKPHEILLVIDAMIGQDAVRVAETFNNTLGVDGIVLTKMDGDARGGAALSVKAVTGKPIKFVGMGEKLDALEQFHPDRMASRILGMGDMLTMIEKAQESFDLKEAAKLEEKLRKQEFTLDDFLKQIRDVKKLGPIEQIIGMIPGLSSVKKQMKDVKVDEKEFSRIEAMICSMTPEERQNPSIIDASRKKRIANGSGTNVRDLNALLKQFESTRKMFKQFSEMTKRGGLKKKMKLPF